MKLNTFFYLFLCAVALSVAVPVPVVPSGQDKQPIDIKGKGKANSPSSLTQSSPGSSPPGSGSHTPTPSEDSDVPLPGRNGVHFSAKKNVATAYYGDDKLPEHMAHVQQNQAAHPGNTRPMSLASDAQHAQNRKDALRGIPSGVNHPVTGEDRVRDEKQLAMLNNPQHGSTTTVQYLSSAESSREGGMTSKLKTTMENHGAKGQLRANPGFLPLSPNQRIAHEAPGRLNSQTFRPSDPNAPAPKKQNAKVDPKVKEETEKKKAQGYVPTAGGMSLRQRIGKAEPAKPAKKDSGTPANPATGTNLVPGRQLPAGHRWEPNQKELPSHLGSPPLNKDSDTRRPPRPQNIDAHRNRPKDAGSVTPPVQDPHPGPKSDKPEHNTQKFKDNLAKFNQEHPVSQKPSSGAGSREAPARLESNHTPPPTQQNLPIRPAPQRGSSSTTSGGGGAGASGSKPQNSKAKKDKKK